NASVNVLAAPIVSVSISPGNSTMQVGFMQQFTATVTGSTNTAVTWLVNGTAGGNLTVGTISSTGLYTAPAVVPSPSSVTVSAQSVADTSKSASASVSITATPPPVTVSISPTSGSVQVMQTLQFSAAVTGTTNTAVIWSVNGTAGGNSTVGTISSSGLYTAPACAPGTPSTVTTTSVYASSVSASAVVSVTGK